MAKEKTEEHRLARELRNQGLSIGEIAKKLRVSKGSISPWVRDIILTEEQKTSIGFRKNTFSPETIKKRQISRQWYSDKYRCLRLSHQNNGREMAKSGDSLFIAGCMLYWAEGAKKRSSLIFTNSDCNMITFFVKFLTKCFNLRMEDLKFSCHYSLSSGLSIEDVESYWSNILRIPRCLFNKTTVSRMPRISGIERQERTKYGVVKVICHKTFVIQSIYGGIQEYCGFNNLEWLNKI